MLTGDTAMKFISAREFRSSIASIREKMKDDEEIILTLNGKPFALVSPVDPDHLDEELELRRRVSGLMALAACQRHSVESGLDKMTMEEINAEIAASRRERAATPVGNS
jgi:antitoxin (DNA-binding transcriptional repressor) of toxin-antitoxin stability system